MVKVARKDETGAPVDPYSPYNGKDRMWQRWSALKGERASWDGHAKDLSRNILPRSSRFYAQDRNRGDKRANAILDSNATRAVRVLAAGMQAGMTSPARPWFRLATGDIELMKYAPVKQWLADVTRLMLTIMARSNTYRALHMGYEELGVFGTFADIISSDFDDVIRHTPLTFGEYCIAANYRGEIDTVYREFDKSVINLVREFGYDNCSSTVQNLYQRKQFDQWITVVHAIEPRVNRDSAKLDKLNMPFSSTYFELEGPKNKFLSEGGFKRFRALCPRWAVTGQDVYGSSPGMEVLGDVRQLQHEQLRKAQGIDYMTKPPLQVPTAMKGQEIDTLPSGISFVDSANPNGGVRAAFQVQLNLDHLLNDIYDVRNRIQQGFYSDMFLMLSQDNSGRMTATEVAERHEEKLLMIGPVLERLHNEMLDPLVEMIFDEIMEAGIAPPPPPELEGMQVDVELVSMLAQAQRAVATNAQDRWVTGLMNVATVKPEILDNLNADAFAIESGDQLSVDPKLLVDEKTVAAIRQQRAAAQAKQLEDAQAKDVADSAAGLSKVPTKGGSSNAGADIMGMFSGYNSPGAEFI